MTYSLSARSRGKLLRVHPDLVAVVYRAITYTEVDFAVTEGVRSIKRQRLLVEQGFSKTLASKHLLHFDGWGHAVDLMAVGDLDKDGDVDAQDKALTWKLEPYMEIARAMKRSALDLEVPLRWGGDFKSFFDGPHFEMIGDVA